MTAVLGAADQATITALSRSHVEMTTAGLKPFLKREIWVGKTNHYAKDVVERLKKAPTTAVKRRNLAQYIAASVSLHANDGWGYLGRAVSCLLAGDTHRALHLAYYAELRAAMSLLASAGIGIFNTRHFAIPAVNSTSKLNVGSGTHVTTWLALEHWAQQPASGALFASLVRPEGRSLDSWFQPQGGASSLAPQARGWFMQWGMDLGFASKDRDARNESSYRPDGIPMTWDAPVKDGLEFVRDTWIALEPSATSSFEQIDRHILRLALERYFHGFTGKIATATDPAFVTLVNNTVSAQSLTTATSTRLTQFLLRQAAPTDPLIFRYSTVAPGTPLTDALAVLSRAVLLLRIATGSAQDLLQQAGFSADALSFWWKKVGETRGLWPAGSPPTALSDLWADVKASLDELADVDATDPTALESINSIAFGMEGRLNVLSSHERVGLWGLCPA
jgi:hypothetical protein